VTLIFVDGPFDREEDVGRPLYFVDYSSIEPSNERHRIALSCRKRCGIIKRRIYAALSRETECKRCFARLARAGYGYNPCVAERESNAGFCESRVNGHRPERSGQLGIHQQPIGNAVPADWERMGARWA
jgi:hypothetical protein